MRKGFIFNHDLCVGCGSCRAACILENRWAVSPRVIYIYNQEVLTSLPLINISLACNHCEKPVCLEGCPAGAYFRDPDTGGIIIDDQKCIGCRYCQWNCPYDAPKFDDNKGVIGKCNLCYSGLKMGRLPSCASACPTGALNYGELTDNIKKRVFSWFPEKDIDPSIELIGTDKINSLKVIPEKINPSEMPGLPESTSAISSEWSLIAFSFLVTLSVSLLVSSIINGFFPDLFLFIPVIVLAGVSSLFHLGKASRAWRSVSNLKTSPLSREIAAFIIYSALSLISLLSEIPILLVASSISGFVLLLLIDNVYMYSDKRMSTIIHGGQTFFSSLIIISFLTGSTIPFIFIAFIKLISSVYYLSSKRTADIYFGFKFLRLVLLIFSGACLLSGQFKSDPVILILLLVGELFDRIIFYIDYKPLNINTSIYDNINAIKNEKKRG